MNMKKLLIPLALLMFSVTAFSGLTRSVPVTIDLVNGNASGDMITARNSDNDFEFIGCGLRAFEDGVGGVFYFGFCQAQLEEGAPVNCFTQNVDLLEGINLISDSSFITFSWNDDGNGGLTCWRIGSSTQSFYLSKQKTGK